MNLKSRIERLERDGGDDLHEITIVRDDGARETRIQVPRMLAMASGWLVHRIEVLRTHHPVD